MLLLLMPARYGERSIWRPAINKTTTNKMVIQANVFRPSTDGLPFAAPFYKHIGSTIAALLFFRYPTAILRSVRTIVVNTIKTLSFRTRTHVGQKRGKDSPALAHGYASGSVVREPVASWVSAARNHVLPTVVRRALARHVGIPHAENLT